MKFTKISHGITFCLSMLKEYGETVSTESWQGIKQERPMFEFCNLYWVAPIPHTKEDLEKETGATMPWAEDHFLERVQGEPLNPGEQYKNWPFYGNKADSDKRFRFAADVHGEGETKFSHTYMERYWPKYAGYRQFMEDGGDGGIRFGWGDLQDVIGLLLREPNTRQAYLPIWFPEDTGVLHGGRVPCTLGYHFIMRNNKLHIHYTIRACDALRHFRNDIYLTGRLLQWALLELQRLGDDDWKNVTPGNITMDIISFHVFEQEKNLI